MEAMSARLLPTGHLELAAHQRNVLDHIFGFLMIPLTAILLIGLVVYLSRWNRVRGATSRDDALRRAFGERGAHRIRIGSLVVAGICFAFAAVTHL